MTATLTDLARPSFGPEPDPSAVAALVAVPPRGGGRTLAAGLMAVGLTLTVGAVGLFATQMTSRTATSRPAPATRIVLDGPESVVVQRSGYDPHETSRWHRHTGLHAVSVISGTLTVYGPDCQAVRYGPGQSYVGGHDVHLARNETDEPVEMTETLLFPAGVPLQDFVVPATAPAGCDL